MDKVKITDIAKQSKVSPTTVSRYFNHPELLSQETQTYQTMLFILSLQLIRIFRSWLK